MHKIVDMVRNVFSSLCLDRCFDTDLDLQPMPHKAVKSESTLCIQALCSGKVHKITVTQEACLPCLPFLKQSQVTSHIRPTSDR